MLKSLLTDILVFGAMELGIGKGCWLSEVGGWVTRDLIVSIGQEAHHPANFSSV